MAASPRVVVWDPQLDWLKRGYTRADRLAGLVAELLEHARTPARVVFRGAVRDVARFQSFCQLAGTWGRLEPATIIVEELSWVTSPGKAPAGWHELVTGALKYGINLVSITQRPQESDKTALSQADVVRCFQLERDDDQKYMAKELKVPVEQIAALGPLDYVEKNRRTRQVTTGRLTF